MTEQLYKLDALPSPIDERDYQAEEIFPADLSLPKVYDPRLKLLDVIDQGAQGSCVACSTAALKEIQEKKNVGFQDYMSPQFVYNNRNWSGDGMFSRDSMSILYKKGIVPEEEYPYGTFGTPDSIHHSILEKAANYRVKGYAYVSTIETAKAAIFRSGGCIATFSVYNARPGFWKASSPKEAPQGMHAVCLVGWNDRGFIIRNSWGESFGDKGYTILPYEDWGLRSEVWTLIDDDSSKPDPKYSKWYWKSWRAVTNTVKNIKTLKYVLALSWIFSIFIAFLENPLALVWIPATLFVVSIWSWRKKLYMAKG